MQTAVSHSPCLWSELELVTYSVNKVTIRVLLRTSRSLTLCADGTRATGGFVGSVLALPLVMVCVSPLGYKAVNDVIFSDIRE